MSHIVDRPEISDICLLLRAHGEQHWMLSTVLPLVQQLERGELRGDGELAAALAYLDVLWIEAQGRAAETDAAFGELVERTALVDLMLHEKAHRYHAAVRRLRASLRGRVERLLAGSGEASAPEPASP